MHKLTLGYFDLEEALYEVLGIFLFRRFNDVNKLQDTQTTRG